MPALMFLTVCPFCGDYLDAQPVPSGFTWGPGVLWGYLAQQQHEPICRPTLPIEVTS